MAFPPSFLDDIRARISLVQLVSRTVPLKQRSRGDWWGLSPFVSEKTPSFHVDENKGFFHCFSSGEHGDQFSWLMKRDGLEFPEAVTRLAAEAGLEPPAMRPEERRRTEARKNLFEVVELAARWFTARLAEPGGRAARDYLLERGLDEAVTGGFRLGYAPPERTALADGLKRDGVDMPALLEAGLYRQGDDGRPPWPMFRDRIMFPVADGRGRLIAFGGRFMGDAAAAGVGKYINSPETPLFAKGRVLYNLHRAAEAARKDGETPVLVEGYMDVIALSQAGFRATTAPLGTALSESQMALVWRLHSEPVLCFDGDRAGLRAARKAAERALAILQPGQSLRFAFPDGGLDPDSYVRQRGTAAMRGLITGAEAMDSFLFRTETGARTLDTPERRADLEARLRRIAGSIGDPMVRRQYERAFSERLWQQFRHDRGSGGRSGTGSNRQRGADAPAGIRLRSALGQLPRRQQQIVLACLINHPELLGEYDEAISGLDYDADLDKLRAALQNLAACGRELHVDAVRDHLRERGLGAELAGVCDADVYRFARQAGPDADTHAARTALDHILAIRAQAALRAEMRDTGRQAAGAGDTRAQDRLIAYGVTLEAGETRLEEALAREENEDAH